METTFIYGLNDPETGECRYVGKANDPRVRLIHHINSDEICHRTSWIKSLKSRGLRPLLEILHEVPQNQWELWEKIWIKVSRELGMNLTNLTGGGDGACDLSPEVRKKMSIDRSGDKNPMFGRKHSEESRKKMGRPKKGIPMPPGFSDTLRARKGEKRTVETREKIKAARAVQTANNRVSGRLPKNCELSIGVS